MFVRTRFSKIMVSTNCKLLTGVMKIKYKSYTDIPQAFTNTLVIEKFVICFKDKTYESVCILTF